MVFFDSCCKFNNWNLQVTVVCLQAFGYHVTVGRRTPVSTHRENQQNSSSSRDGDRVSVDVHSNGSESVFPFTQNSETPDPFSFVPTSSPQLVQVCRFCATRKFQLHCYSSVTTQSHQCVPKWLDTYYLDPFFAPLRLVFPWAFVIMSFSLLQQFSSLRFIL